MGKTKPSWSSGKTAIHSANIPSSDSRVAVHAGKNRMESVTGWPSTSSADSRVAVHAGKNRMDSGTKECQSAHATAESAIVGSLFSCPCKTNESTWNVGWTMCNALFGTLALLSLSCDLSPTILCMPPPRQQRFQPDKKLQASTPAEGLPPLDEGFAVPLANTQPHSEPRIAANAKASSSSSCGSAWVPPRADGQSLASQVPGVSNILADDLSRLWAPQGHNCSCIFDKSLSDRNE